MNRRLRSLTDEELAEHCKYRPWEDELQRIGCWLMLLSVFVSIFACLVVDRGPIWLEIPVGVVLFPFLIYVLTHGAANTRSRPYLQELKRRYGQLGFDAEIAEAKRRLTEDSPALWILLLQGISSSNYTHYASVRITLYEKVEIPAHLEAVTSPGAESGLLFDVGRICQGVVDLGNEESQGFLRFLEQLGAGSLRDIPSTIGKAYPCSVAAIRKDPPLELRGSCDLLGTSEADANKPTAILIRRIMALAERASSSPMIQGWGEYFGDSRDPNSVAPFKLPLSPTCAERLMEADWTVTLELRTLPYGGSQCVRIDLIESNRATGTLTAQRRPYRYNAEDPRERISKTRRDLECNEAEPLLTWLRELQPGTLKSITPGVIDGAPCIVNVWRRNPPSRQSVECNLGGLSPSQRKSPTVTLIIQLLKIARGGPDLPGVWPFPRACVRQARTEPHTAFHKPSI